MMRVNFHHLTGHYPPGFPQWTTQFANGYSRG